MIGILLSDGVEIYGRIQSDDSEMWLTDEFLYALHFEPEKFGPYMSVTRPIEGHGSTGHGVDQYDCHVGPGEMCFANTIVKVSNGQQNWVYKVIEYDMCKNAWFARWPDQLMILGEIVLMEVNGWLKAVRVVGIKEIDSETVEYALALVELEDS